MGDRERKHGIFRSSQSRRLAALFAVVYFSQGMWGLPVQAITIVFKELGYPSARVADFFLWSTIPWVIKPLYGLVSDFIPILGYRRKSYFLIMSALATGAALMLSGVAPANYGRLAALYTLMGFALAFTDVLTDALMVETGKPLGLTGAFQSVQWAAINSAILLVGVLGGRFAEERDLRMAFLISAIFPLISLAMALLNVKEKRRRKGEQVSREAWGSIRAASRDRNLWAVAAFIFFFNFSPSFGPAFLYYQTDALGFSQQFIGILGSLTAIGSVVGALAYAPLSKRVPLKRTIRLSIGVAVIGTLAYFAYRGPVSAIAIDLVFGGLSMVIQLAFLDLAAKACPKFAEGTFFALLMSIHNGSTQLSKNVGARLYDSFGFTPLVLVSAGMTALAWVFVPLVHIESVEKNALRDLPEEEVAA